MTKMAENEKSRESVREPEGVFVLAGFLESCPPGRHVNIIDMTTRRPTGGIHDLYQMNRPDLQLYCSSDKCNGVRFFRASEEAPYIHEGKGDTFYLEYICSNCQNTSKIFSLAAIRDKGKPSGKCFKFGEMPPFGPQTPARLITLIGPDREIFLKGRRCESQGLGIGAFIYYRRVVEHEKNRILAEIIKVAEKVGAGAAAIDSLRRGVAETRFSEAMQLAKDAIPQSLLVNGQNPLTLLHGALSEGVHELSDEECLETASSIRVVLGELAERLAQALKDEDELKKALSSLTNRKRRDALQ